MGLAESTVGRWSGPSKSRSVSQFSDGGYDSRARQCATLPNRSFGGKPPSPTAVRHHHSRGPRDCSLGAGVPGRDHLSGELARERRCLDDRGRPVTRGRRTHSTGRELQSRRSRSANRPLQVSPQDSPVISFPHGAVQSESIHSPERCSPSKRKSRSHHKSKNSSKSRHRSCARDVSCTNTTFPSHADSPNIRRKKLNRRSDPLMDAKVRSGNEPEVCGKDAPLCSLAGPAEVPVYRDRSKSRPRPSAIYVPHDDPLQTVIDIASANEQMNAPSTRFSNRNISEETSKHISTLTLSASSLRDRNPVGHNSSLNHGSRETMGNYYNRPSRFLRDNLKSKTEPDMSECFDCNKLLGAEYPNGSKDKTLTLSTPCMNSPTSSLNSSVDNVVSTKGNLLFPERSEVCIQLQNLHYNNNNEYKMPSNTGVVEVQPNVWFESRRVPDHGICGNYIISNSYPLPDPRFQTYSPCNSSAVRFPLANACEMDLYCSQLDDYRGKRRASPIDHIDPGVECNSVTPAFENPWYDAHLDARICDGQLHYFDSTQVDYSHIPFIFNDGPPSLRNDPRCCEQFHHHEELSPIHSNVPSSSVFGRDLSVQSVSRDATSRHDPLDSPKCLRNRITSLKALRPHGNSLTLMPPESGEVCGSMRSSCNRENPFCQESSGRMLISDVNSNDRCSVNDRANSCVGGPQQTEENIIPFCPPPPPRPDARRDSSPSSVLASDVMCKCSETVNCDQCSASNSDHLPLSSCYSLRSFDHNSLSVSEPGEFSEESLDFAEEYSPVMAELRLPLLDNQPRLVDILNMSSPSLDEVESIVSDVCKESENEQPGRPDANESENYTLLDDDFINHQNDSSLSNERCVVEFDSENEREPEKLTSDMTLIPGECVAVPSFSQTLKNSENISASLSSLTTREDDSSLHFKPDLAGFCDQMPCLPLNAAEAALCKPEVKRNSWSPWSALASSAATLRDRIHAAGGRRAKRGWLPRQGKANSMVVLIEAPLSADHQQSSAILEGETLNTDATDNEGESSTVEDILNSKSDESSKTKAELQKNMNVEECVHDARSIDGNCDHMKTECANEKQRSRCDVVSHPDADSASCVREPLCAEQQELVNHGPSSEVQCVDAGADCGYTCHEQCRPLVAIDCRARHTPESDPTCTADRATPPLPAAAQTPAKHLEAATNRQSDETPLVSYAPDDVQESKELKEKSNDLKSSGYHSKSSDQDCCPSDEDEDDSSDYATLENDHPLTRGSLTIKDGLSTVELQQHLLHCSAERSSGHGSATLAPEPEKHEAEKQEKDLVNGTSIDCTSLRRAIEGLCDEGVAPAHLESWLLDTAAAQGLQLSREEDGSYRGCLRVHLNLSRPINIVAGTRPPSIYDILKEDRTLDKTLTSFYMPRNAVKAIHITSNTTTREVIVALLRKFKVVDNPQKFALYERSFDCHSNNGSLRRISDTECPLVLAMQWTAEGLTAHRVVLQENDTADIQWDAFSLPELNNFLRILDREEEDYRSQILDKYARIRGQIRERLAFQQ